MSESYLDWIDSRVQSERKDGIELTFDNPKLFDFQRSLCEWALRGARSAVFADCGLGKTVIQLVWADNVARAANKPVLVLTPLSVWHQTVAEAVKFGIDSERSGDGTFNSSSPIVVTNYERLHYFDSNKFAGVVCDESSILKNFDGSRKRQITEFMRKTPFRLLCTATASPNDYIELGTSSEALGELGYIDMLSMFFTNKENSNHPMWKDTKWRFKGHAEKKFWQWVTSWARAVRTPSDLGYSDDGFELPPLIEKETVISASRPRDGLLFDLPAMNLHEQREERRRTLPERCEAAAAAVADTGEPAVMWCHLNDEGNMLESLVDGSVQVSGSDSDEKKEESFEAFESGDVRVLITKPKIGGFGLNWQHCSHQTFFPSHSYEQYYQGVRRCWRYGQTKPVTIDIISSEGERGVLRNIKRKSAAAAQMFKNVVACMSETLELRNRETFPDKEIIPSWL